MSLKKATGLAAATLLAVGIFASPEANAKEVKASGTNVYITVDSDVDDINETSKVLRAHSRTIVLADDENSPFHLQSQDCQGTYIIDNEGNVVSGSGYCDHVDDDGDAWWIWWKTARTAADGSFGVLGGTGKYEGMTGSGTTETVTESADGRYILRWEGTFDMK